MSAKGAAREDVDSKLGVVFDCICTYSTLRAALRGLKTELLHIDLRKLYMSSSENPDDRNV
jgi:hypothetical protein